jgi:hypothetical protein
VLLWEIAAQSGFIVAESVSYPERDRARRLGAALDGSLVQGDARDLRRALAGMALGARSASSAGIAFGLSRLLAALMRPLDRVAAADPSVALIPLALLIYGYGFRMEIAVVAFACFWPLLIITESAVRGIEPRLLEVSRALGFGIAARVSRSCCRPRCRACSSALRPRRRGVARGRRHGRDHRQPDRARLSADRRAGEHEARPHVRVPDLDRLPRLAGQRGAVARAAALVRPHGQLGGAGAMSAASGGLSAAPRSRSR